jgi:hypothetical protein
MAQEHLLPGQSHDVDIKTKKNAAGSRQSSLFKELKFRVDSTTTLNATCLTLKPPFRTLQWVDNAERIY